jgi:hypothetical protein
MQKTARGVGDFFGKAAPFWRKNFHIRGKAMNTPCPRNTAPAFKKNDFSQQ